MILSSDWTLALRPKEQLTNNSDGLGPSSAIAGDFPAQKYLQTQCLDRQLELAFCSQNEYVLTYIEGLPSSYHLGDSSTHRGEAQWAHKMVQNWTERECNLGYGLVQM